MRRTYPNLKQPKPCPKCYAPMRPIKGEKDMFSCPTHGIPNAKKGDE